MIAQLHRVLDEDVLPVFVQLVLVLRGKVREVPVQVIGRSRRTKVLRASTVAVSWLYTRKVDGSNRNCAAEKFLDIFSVSRGRQLVVQRLELAFTCASEARVLVELPKLLWKHAQTHENC